MITISNSLTFVRAPLALLFLQENPNIRFLAIVLAMISDSIDGYFARKHQSVSRFGSILDPLMDKFFVTLSLSVLLLEGRIELWQMGAMLSRDFFVCLYILVIFASQGWKSIAIRSIRWGKITTSLQFIVLMGLVYNVQIPWFLFVSFFLMGGMAFIELVYSREKPSEA